MKRNELSNWPIGLIGAAMIVGLLILWLVPDSAGPSRGYEWGESALAAIVMFAGLAALTWAIRPETGMSLVTGADGRASTSKFQFYLWTVAVTTSYVALYTAATDKNVDWQVDFPPHLLLAMGISAVTAVGAKSITSQQVLTGRVDKSSAKGAATGETPAEDGSSSATGSDGPTGATALVTDDSGSPSLTKFQVVAWTFIALATYANATITAVGHIYTDGKLAAFPDIDATLLVLMGLANGTYLGAKLVTTDTPRVTGIRPAIGSAGTSIDLLGAGFGPAASGGQVLVSGVPVGSDRVTDWQASKITFSFPETTADGTNWPIAKDFEIGVVASGVKSVGNPQFRIAGPKIDALDPIRGTAGSTLEIRGEGFGMPTATAKVIFGTIEIASADAIEWSPRRIRLVVPRTTPEAVVVKVAVQGVASPTLPFTVT